MHPLGVVTGIGIDHGGTDGGARFAEQLSRIGLVVSRSPTDDEPGRNHRAAQHGDRELHVLFSLHAATSLKIGTRRIRLEAGRVDGDSLLISDEVLRDFDQHRVDDPERAWPIREVLQRRIVRQFA